MERSQHARSASGPLKHSRRWGNAFPRRTSRMRRTIGVILVIQGGMGAGQCLKGADYEIYSRRRIPIWEVSLYDVGNSCRNRGDSWILRDCAQSHA